MKKEESLALEYLTRVGFKNIVYEPDGNVPPDFLIDKSIAVEVRRLNQNFEGPHRTKGLEELEYPLRQKIEKLLSSIETANFDKSYFVLFRFRRPLNVNVVVDEARNALIRFSSSAEHLNDSDEITINDHFDLQLIRASTKLAQFFVFGGYSDLDEGGFVISEVCRNLKICLDEKTEKIKSYKSKYPQWYLMLIDHIGYGLREDDVSQLKEAFRNEHDWDKIILVNPLNPSQGVEL
jgi:hypothetical protein